VRAAKATGVRPERCAASASPIRGGLSEVDDMRSETIAAPSGP
jgi:hypothetical protein